MKKSIACLACGKTTKGRFRKFCSDSCRIEYWNEKRKTDHTIRPCAECGLPFKPRTRQQACCSDLCRMRQRTDTRYFGGLRKTAVGFDTRTCWICGKAGLDRPHVHHVVGRENAQEPLVVLCAGCHALVSKLGKRNFLDNAEMVEDLLTLARFVKGLPNVRTIVKFEEVK